MRTSHRSRCCPGMSSAQCTPSHSTSAVESMETVYTFSFTVDWFHTVQVSAPTRMPANAAASRAQRTGTTSRIQRSATRKRSPAVAALVKAANRLMRTA